RVLQEELAQILVGIEVDENHIKALKRERAGQVCGDRGLTDTPLTRENAEIAQLGFRRRRLDNHWTFPAAGVVPAQGPTGKRPQAEVTGIGTVNECHNRVEEPAR